MDNDKLQLITELFAQMPGRARTAFAAIEFCKSISDPCQCNPQAQGRALTGPERALYMASLDAIRQYVAGETDMGGPRTVGGYDTEALLEEARADLARNAKSGENVAKVDDVQIRDMVKAASDQAATESDRTEPNSDGPDPGPVDPS